jgi:hypothetical protein
MRTRVILAGAVSLLIPVRTWASTDKWTGNVTNWSSNTGWSLNHPPGNLDTVVIAGSSGGTNVITFDATATASNLTTLWIDAPNVSTSTKLAQTAGSLTTNLEIVGFTNAGNLFISGGTHTIGGSGSNGLYVGFNLNSTGNLNISNGALNISNSAMVLGLLGTGSVTQSGGNVFVGGSGSNGLIIGDNWAGTYNMSGGTLAATNSGVFVGLNVGFQNAFNQSGGTVTAGTLEVGEQGPAAYAMSNGATLIVNGTTTVGDFTTGSLSVSGGIATLSGDLIIGNTSLGAGTFVQGGGAVSVVGNVLLGVQSGSSGSAALSGGTFSAAGIYIGGGSNAAGGNGTLTVSGANLTAAAIKVYPGNALVLSSGTVSAGTLDLGGNSSRLNWSGGTLQISGSNGVEIDGSSVVGSSWTLGAGQNLLVSASELIGSGTNVGSFTQSGGTHTVAGTLTVGNGSYSFNDGSLTANVVNNSAFTQNGGALTGSVTNTGNFNFSGGTFGGSLNIALGGNATFTGSFVAGASVMLQGNATVSATAKFNTTSGFDSEGGSLTLAGGTMGGSGPILNNGLIQGFGMIGGTGGFTNAATVTQGAGNLTLSNKGPSVNNGTINLATGRQLVLTAAFSNAASISLNGANISGTAALANLSTGSVSGAGTISAPLSNSGNIVVDSGTLNVTSVFTNNGNIQLGGLTAGFNGSGVVNASELQGFGSVGAPVTNSGTIEAIGGILTISSPLNNTASGLLKSSTGNKLLLSGGLASNNGQIGLTGGIVDTNAQPMVNNGQISGFGTLSTGGLTNATGASIVFAGGTSTLFGALTNNVGGTVQVNLATAVFQGPVVNNGFMQVTGANVTFAAGFTDNGIFASDPSTHSFTNLSVGKSGAIVAATDRFVLSGDLTSSSTQNAMWNTREATLEFSGVGAHALSVNGADVGDGIVGETNNFAWGTLQVDAGGSLTLVDGDTASGGALYVGTLDLVGVPLDATLATFIAGHITNSDASDPMNIYYDPMTAGDAYLADQTFSLGNGGLLSPLVPEPGAAAGLAIMTATHLCRRRVRRRA